MNFESLRSERIREEAEAYVKERNPARQLMQFIERNRGKIGLVMVLSACAAIFPDRTKEKIEITPQVREELEEEDKIADEVGLLPILAIEACQSVANDNERGAYMEKSGNAGRVVSGFEKMEGGLSNKEVDGIIRALPAALNADIPMVEYRNEHKTLDSKYGKNLQEKSEIAAQYDRIRNKITVLAGMENESASTVVKDIIHEVAHSKDWESNRLLTKKERIDLLRDVVGRVKSADRYQSSYVESIENGDRREELYLKASEYFAEINAEYFTHNTLLPEGDRRIVERVIIESKVDKEFTRRTVAAFNKTIKQIVARHQGRQSPMLAWSR
ncbi:MAG: hypothetical protein KGJ13_00565 [Patescibacteria group bacterium]|nr:hypothetical protein [Patescibacteria group bacterium]